MTLKISSTKVSLIDDNYQKIMSELGDFFGVKWIENQPKIIIVDSRETFDEVMNKKTEKWLIGHASNRTIYVLDGSKFKTEADREYNEEKYLALIKHELSHLFIEILNQPYIPLWLNEGIAIYIAGQNKSRKNIPTEFKNFLKFSKESIFGKETVYEESGFVIETLINKFNKEKLIKLIKSGNKDNESFNKCFKNIYGFDLSYININKIYHL